MIKNLFKSKNPKFYITVVTVIIFVVALVVLVTNLKSGPEDVAEEFLEVLTTPEDSEFAEYYDDIFYAGNTQEETIENFVKLIEKEYRPFMTEEAYNNAVSNRFIPWIDLIRKDTDYKIIIDSINLSKQKIDSKGRINYGYSISLSVNYSYGRSEVATVSGLIVMIEKDNQWKVDAFTADYRNLSKILID